MANSIIAGNDFRLIIRAKKSTGAYLADMDLADVEDLRIYLTRAGRSKVLQSYTLDEEGHAVIYVSAGVVTNATYGIEMVGVYGGARLRAHNTSVFTISGHGGGNSGVLNDYYADIVFVINVAATDVYVQNAIEAHNEDEASHPHLLQLIEEAGDVDDVQIDGESIVDENKIAKIDSSQFGKVDDVKVNGTSVVSNKEANITIPEKVSDLPNDADYATKPELAIGLAAKQDTITAVAEPTIADDGGNPSASVDFEDGEMAFSFKNLKLRFSDLTPEERATLKGDKGDKGDSAIFTGEGEPWSGLKNATGQSTTEPMSQKAVTDAVNRLEPSFSNQDFGFADENGYYIAQFDNGHIKTKNFDSSEAVVDKDIPIVDFAIEDGNGYDIATFARGHIKTKNFNSANVRIFKDNDGIMRIPFSYGVDCIKPYRDDWSTADNLNGYVNQSVCEDNAVLYLPASYDPAGTPTRLIIYCKHGASTVEPEADSVLSTSGDGNIFRFLISIGYAVLAADGVPNDYASLIGITERVVGNYIAVQSTRAAYNYVVNNYNIATDGVFVYGWSQGGHYAQNVTDLCGLNVLAVAELCPVCSFRYHQWDLVASVSVGGVTWTNSARLNIARLFGFPSVTTDAELKALEYNAKLVEGYDPWTRNVEEPYTGFVQSSGSNLWKLPNGVFLSDITMKKYLKAPLKIWASTNDPTLGTDVMKVFIQAAKNAGCIADMHLHTNGSHNINSLQTSIGSFDFFGTSSPLYPMALEVARWFRDFGGLSFTATINS